MKIFCSHQKRYSMYKNLHTELSRGHLHPDEILRICKSEKIPLIEESLIATAISSGHCQEGLCFAQQITRSVHEVQKNVLTHIIGPVLLLTLSALIIFCMS
ncbi:TPA: hypothetical protein ACWV6Y_005546 [Salmonella enterica subsp. enterica serovar Muenchen]